MNSIKSKINLLVSSAVFVSIAIISVITLLIFYNTTVTEAKENYLMLVSGYKQVVDNKINTLEKQLEMVAKNKDITDATLTLEEREELLNSYAENSGFNYISVSDENGLTYRNSDISEREYFQKALSGTDYMSDPVINKVDGKLTIMFAVPINNGTEYKGVVYAGIPYEEFISQLISTIKVGESGYAFVVNKNGSIIAHPDSSKVEEGTNYIGLSTENNDFSSIATMIESMTNGGSDADFISFEGQKWLSAYIPMSGPEGCSIALMVPRS